MTLLAELEGVVGDHRPHGMLTCDATEPTWNGYLLTVACPCGVTFEVSVRVPWLAPLITQSSGSQPSVGQASTSTAISRPGSD
jgi:hypothetical protein